MEFIITAPLTAIRVPDDYSEENSLSLITSIYISPRKESGLAARDFQGSIVKGPDKMHSNKPINQNPWNGEPSSGAVIWYKQILQVG